MIAHTTPRRMAMKKLVSVASMAALAAIAVSASVEASLAHGLHTSCMYGSVSPSGQGGPTIWHRTPEAGVHIACTPPHTPKGGLKLKLGEAKRKGLSLKL
jgi:hypothetical protein